MLFISVVWSGWEEFLLIKDGKWPEFNLFGEMLTNSFVAIAMCFPIDSVMAKFTPFFMGNFYDFEV